METGGAKDYLSALAGSLNLVIFTNLVVQSILGLHSGQSLVLMGSLPSLQTMTIYLRTSYFLKQVIVKFPFYSEIILIKFNVLRGFFICYIK